jgi:Spy/CpxP family protein refolding chaperone
MKLIHGILKLTSLAAFAFTANLASSQESEHHRQSTAPFGQEAKPYAGQQTRSIKALSAREAQDWLDGKGLGLAKAAELNGYPGPMHVLDLQNQLKLTDEQKQATQLLMAAHKSEVRKLGVQLVAAEQALDLAFSSKQIDAAAVDHLTSRIGQLQAEIRASHLKTHLQQAKLLQADQIDSYSALRGYSH